MHLPFTAYLNEFRPYLCKDLISSTMLSSLKDFAQALPKTQSGVLECRLNNNQENVDYQICVEPHINIQPYAFDETFYLYLKSFYRSWHSQNSILNKQVKNIWLEFDTKNTHYFNKVPCLFTHLYKSFRKNPLPIAQAFLSHFKYFSEAQCLLYVEQCINLLPADLNFVYLGYLCSRPNPALRIGLYGNSLRELIDYLGAIGWQEHDSRNQVEILKLFSPITTYLTYFMLSFDFHTAIFPRVGLECYLSPNSYDYLDWQPALDYLVSSHLCSPQKREALLKWHQPSLAQKMLPKGSSSLFSQSINTYFSTSSICRHALNHIKLVYNPFESIEAKAYLGFTSQ